ncbi:hypothetical protein AB0E62_10295 [Streptomyces sp. NPDC038707]|uniref:hypothetical protein n=1 Tax=Streptomyces sp. NPDC038707 TaxID=3154329 RepID=UPI0033D2104D
MKQLKDHSRRSAANSPQMAQVTALTGLLINMWPTLSRTIDRRAPVTPRNGT